ncbi:hypothetical protein [Paraflavitalea pollutisoli]|uniref:hypothetical protein n=1 Tax=Paraflavitalea pollutisoli TaxID=3034143 RepID=UPI0023ED67F5|nr:hypothetical protein [Paraflavitalea sp. H1-2-19X]
MNAAYRFVAIALLLSASTTTRAQRISEDFTVTLPEEKVPNSLYNTLQVIDGRRDTSEMGIVQLGAFNRKAWVRPEVPITTQLQSVFNALIDPAAQNGKLVLLLRNLRFAEITKAMSESGYCYLRADMFSEADGIYKPLGKIDTMILVKSMDVTRALFRRGSKTVVDFMAQQLSSQPTTGDSYTLNDVLAYNTVQKRKLPLYKASVLQNGVYRSFTAFLQQQPDTDNAQVTFDKTNSIKKVNIAGADGKPVKVKASEMYALVHDGKPYIATKYGYYPLEKRGDDFFFTGKAEVTANTGDVVVASLFFGIIGGLIASDASAQFEMKIDHINGGFERIKQLPSASQ